jgi:hypothetical protein
MAEILLDSGDPHRTLLPFCLSEMSPVTLLLAPLPDTARAGGLAPAIPSDADWDRLVLTHSSSSFFPSFAWLRVLMRTYGHKPFYLRLTSDDKDRRLAKTAAGA